MTYKFYDTSALINNIDRIFDNPDDIICISSVTLEELEHLKATNRANANHVLNVLENHDDEYYSVLYKEKNSNEEIFDQDSSFIHLSIEEN